MANVIVFIVPQVLIFTKVPVFPYAPLGPVKLDTDVSTARIPML